MKGFYSKVYEINPLTMAVISERDMSGRRITRIIEEETELLVEDSPRKIIDFGCKFFGASLKGRQEGTADVCGITYKAPISIDPASGMYFFPTHSPTNPKCSWISHTHIDTVNKAENNKTEIVFKNGKKIILDVSYGSVLNQIQRTAQFRYLLDNRIKYLMQEKTDIVAEPSP